MSVSAWKNDASRVPGAEETADLRRSLRLFVAQVESAEHAGAVVKRDSALFRAAKRILTGLPSEGQSTRTAKMALRDLVWRVDCVRTVLESHDQDPAVAEAISLLDTSDIHLFLRQEP